MKYPDHPFTMTEFMEKNDLGLNPHDVPAIRILSQHLREQGYRRVKRRLKVVWIKGDRLDTLREKLR